MAIAFAAVAGDGYAACNSRAAIVYEDVQEPIGVVSDDVGGVGVVRNRVAVRI